ncbi:hypothetical protein BX666DRAFT_1913376 [Dichotomocladium elegans]|nr:hypothetical protein BX666DRAFT_1913376 [Dichotomocladium elegans]
MLPRQAIMAASRRAYSTHSSGAPKRRVGALRGGLLGFLLGTGACIAVSEQFMQQEFLDSTRHLAKSVDELRVSTEKVREYADIVERLDRDYHQLKSNIIGSKDLAQLRREIYKAHDIISHEHVQLKARVNKIGKQ